MRAHTITSKPKLVGRVRTKRTIASSAVIALGLGFVLLASSGRPAAALVDSTSAGPAPPLSLDLHARTPRSPRRRLEVLATTSNDSTLVARGSKIRTTTKRLAAGERTRIKAGVKLKRFCERPGQRHTERVTIKFAATDEFGQTATRAIRLKLYVSDDGDVGVMGECPCHNPLPPCSGA